MSSHIPTSKILENLLQETPTGSVALGWIVANLKERSFGIVILLIALVGLLPGASLFAGLLLFIPAIQMILGRAAPTLPRRIAQRKFSTVRLQRLVWRILPPYACSSGSFGRAGGFISRLENARLGLSCYCLGRQC